MTTTRDAVRDQGAGHAAQLYDWWHRHRSAHEGVSEGHIARRAVWHEMVIPRLGDLRGRSVVEIGCGRGDFSIFLSQHGARVTGLDFSQQAIAIARERAAVAKATVQWQIGDAMKLPFRDRSFDLVVSCECLEHVLDPLSMLKEVRRVCRPGGRVLLTTPSSFNGQLLAWMRSCLLRRPYNSGSGVQPHENLFFFFTVKRLLRRAGLDVRETDSRVFQFLLLPRVPPQRLRIDTFQAAWLNRVFRPLGLHFLYIAEPAA